MIKNYVTYIKESSSKFEIGDRVLYDTVGSDEIGIESGVIINMEESSALVKFDNEWTEDLHDGDGKDPDSMSWWCHMSSGYLKKDKPPIIIISQEDPYGEEDWGE